MTEFSRPPAQKTDVRAVQRQSELDLYISARMAQLRDLAQSKMGLELLVKRSAGQRPLLMV
ncbi:hypothetical protein A3753_30015 [Sulfitobacter sp. HI0082]|nr:hypothetical protein A3753_30015 [Sulfitobacter sp. HI0082]